LGERSGESSSGENSEVYHIRNILLQLIAYLFGGGQYPPNKGKQIWDLNWVRSTTKMLKFRI